MRWLAALSPIALAGLSLAAAPVDDLGDVLAALRHGMHAHGAAGRARAGDALHASDARPLPGEADWAARWSPAPRSPYRDRALGPAYKVLTLSPRGHLHLDQIFFAGQRAEVAAVADPLLAFDLDVAIAGRQVGCTSARQGTRCSWVPDYTARYSIDLVSRGDRDSRFYIVLR